MNSSFDLSAIRGFFSTLTLHRVLPAVIILAVGLIVVRIMNRLFAKALKRSKLDPTLHGFLRSIFRIVLLALLIIIAASTLGIDMTSLVALFSVLALAISLAVQGALANVAGGIQLLASHPFRVDDYVEIGGQAGTVKRIGLVYTDLLTVDNKRVFIPNSDISAAKIINYSSQPLRRVDLTFTASYDCAVDAVKAALAEAIRRVPTALQEPAPFIRVNAYQESSIEYVIRVWTDSAAYWDTHFDLLETVKTVFDEQGIVMTYPHLNVHMDA